jgi:hypothetical protein
MTARTSYAVNVLSRRGDEARETSGSNRRVAAIVVVSVAVADVAAQRGPWISPTGTIKKVRDNLHVVIRPAREALEAARNRMSLRKTDLIHTPQPSPPTAPALPISAFAEATADLAEACGEAGTPTVSGHTSRAAVTRVGLMEDYDAAEALEASLAFLSCKQPTHRSSYTTGRANQCNLGGFWQCCAARLSGRRAAGNLVAGERKRCCRELTQSANTNRVSRA